MFELIFFITFLYLIWIMYPGILGAIISKRIHRQSKVGGDEGDSGNDSGHRNNDGDIITDINWHDVLGVKQDATLSEIQAAYKRLISQYHPDKVQELGDELKLLADKKSKQINGAYNMAIKIKRST